MRVYTVHLRRHGLDAERDLAFVKEGFSWPAFFAGVLWALWHRLWWFALALVGVEALLAAFVYASGADDVTELALTVGVALGVGWIANDWRRRALEKKDFAFVGVVAAKNGDDATRRFLDAEPDLARRVGLVGVP